MLMNNDLQKNNGQGHEFGSYITLVDKQIIIFLCTLAINSQSKDIHEACNLLCP
jgi:putative component of toxin-antitoxin plasmid stabilization module